MISKEEESKYLENPNIWRIKGHFLKKNELYLADKKRIISIDQLA
jgi:hypothetical protein